MLSLFLCLYVLSEPFELLYGRWSGIAALSSVVWAKGYNQGEIFIYDLHICYALALIMTYRTDLTIPIASSVLCALSPFTADELMYFYLHYVYVIYQIYKLGETRFMMNF